MRVSLVHCTAGAKMTEEYTVVVDLSPPPNGQITSPAFASSSDDITAVARQSSDSAQSLSAESGGNTDSGSPADSGNSHDRLTFWKDCVRQNVRGSYLTVGEALYSVLHDEKLLKATSFIKWAHHHFGLTRSTAYEYIRAYRIVEMIREQDPSLPVPSTLSHFRVFNKISLKDGGVKAFRLWKTILNTTRPEHRQKLTAKEVLSKGRKILESEGVDGMHDMVDYGDQDSITASLPDLTPAPTSSGKRRRPVREQARRATRYLHSMRDDLNSEDGSDYAAQSDYEEEPVLVETPPSSRRSSGGQPKPKRRRGSPKDSRRRSSASLSPDAPPSLIPIEPRKAHALQAETMTPVRLAALAKRLVPGGFDVSVCPADTVDEERVVAARTTYAGDGYCRPWSGTVWGNFSGPNFEKHDVLGPYIRSAIRKFNSGEFESGIFVVNLAFGSNFFPELLEFPHCFLFRPLTCMTDGQEEDAVTLCDYHVLVAYFGGDPSQFVNLMSNFGSIPGVNSWCIYPMQ